MTWGRRGRPPAAGSGGGGKSQARRQTNVAENSACHRAKDNLEKGNRANTEETRQKHGPVVYLYKLRMVCFKSLVPLPITAA